MPTPAAGPATLDADQEDGLAARYWKIEDLQGKGEPPALPARKLKEEVAELHAISADEPNSFGATTSNTRTLSMAPLPLPPRLLCG